jgi:glycosyltransferase involved in cell wall biosynthesis
LTETRPFISVVVPTHDRPAPLGRCLRALAGQDYPVDSFEIIVVDDGSAPPVDRAGVIDPGCALRVVRQACAGPGVARNHGASLARGELLAFTDDDCEPDARWLSAIAGRWRDRPGHLIGGQTINRLIDDPYASASQFLISYLYEYYDRDHDDSRFFTSNNMAVSLDEFQRIGGFDRRFGLAAAEDRDLCDRWRHSGRRMAYAPGAVVRHAHAANFRGFCRQHFRYGRGAAVFRHFRAARSSDRIRIEPLHFYTGIARYPFGRAPFGRAARLSLLMLATQAVGAAGFFTELLSGRWRPSPS